MSKDNSNLRLLGSPVNLSYRSKKKDDRKLIRNRPRSALQNSCFTPDIQESYKRPFSADAKERVPSTRTFFKTFSAELLQSYNNSPTTIKILPPTADLLGDSKSTDNPYARKDKDLCSNASDYGSEDTFISLGTKIKAKAQVSPSPKVRNSSQKFLKYRNIAKKGRKVMDAPISEEKGSEYGLEVKITERARSQSPSGSRDEIARCLSPSFKTRAYESYFVPIDSEKNDLAGRVSFGEKEDVENAINVYSKRLMQTQQQLSLVEEESIQDLESVPSATLSKENSLTDQRNTDVDDVDGALTDRNTYVVDGDDEKDSYPRKPLDYIAEARTYNSFYDDFRSSSVDNYKSKMSSTVVHTDSSSKDSGYPSSANDDKRYGQGFSLPTTSHLRKSNSDNKIGDQPKSLDSVSTNSNEQYPKTFPSDKKFQWTEPLNHSRLLYKDFFLKKEGHIAIPPTNSPSKSELYNIPGISETTDVVKANSKNETSEYPTYLLNSTTKAYTSKVIEDYKKELEAINNLHELTIKDMQTDAISPTPLNIDKMFEQHSSLPEDKREAKIDKEEAKNSNNLDMRKRDVDKLTTKELIQNYLKVKGGNTKEFAKNLKKFENIEAKHNWNNKTSSSINKNAVSVIRNQTQQRNMFTLKTPLSARIEDVQNDKDIDSWMSLSAPSPRLLQLDEINTPSPPLEQIPEIAPNVAKSEETVKIPENKSVPAATQEKKSPKSKELNTKSTVLDIYSMLKEIESFGDNPVTSVINENVIDHPKSEDKEERAATPKDNFMEIFEFLEKVEQSANDALSVVTSTTPQTIPKLEALLKLPQTELAQRLVTASLQLEERSCCIALLQESLANHKEQMVNKVSNLEKQSLRNVSKAKSECEEAIKRHQAFIDQLINDKKTLNHRIEQLVDERRSLEERWKRSAQALEDRYKLELRNQHDKMAAAQQELTVKGLEGELREMADRQQKEIADLKMHHAELSGRQQARHAQELEELRRSLEEEKEAALLKERQLASSRLEKQILELELTYQEQRTRLVAEMRAENERVASGLSEREKSQKASFEKWREEQEKLLEEKRLRMEQELAKDREKLMEQMKLDREELEQEFEQHKREFEAEQQLALKKRVTEIAAQHKQERDREIERAIESMEAEAQAGRRELQDAMRRNKEQYELELRELAETEQATLRRYQEAQARIRQTEDRCAELEITITQLETRNKVITEKNSQLEASAEQIRSSCELAWRQKVEALEREMEDLKKTHEEQMHQLYAKVKVAVARKDSAIQALTREAAKYQEKITMLEQKLQQQRKDFLKQK
ncbi:hypothetical protein MSG28_010430 [Choristoneura fumiferana]|uniref:Uncharacterized protein n=1 Tax=Choristoneura fumiferana TaxID=7141 RepID=A0ACC0KLA9_CHOFU|nr:hypothetical protein MSG28_010430 [Choristoneura fumiferana]